MPTLKVVKNMRWTLRELDNAENACLHIQMQGTGGNRSYGDAFDVPMSSLWGPCPSVGAILHAVQGDIRSLASDKRYTKGRIVVFTLDDGRRVMRLYFGRSRDCPHSWLQPELDDALQEHTEFAYNTGLQFTS